MKLAVDGCGIGSSSILYGFLSVRLYLEYQKAGWTWSMSQELLWYIFAPILTEALKENLSISHLGHAAGFCRASCTLPSCTCIHPHPVRREKDSDAQWYGQEKSGYHGRENKKKRQKDSS